MYGDIGIGKCVKKIPPHGTGLFSLKSILTMELPYTITILLNFVLK